MKEPAKKELALKGQALKGQAQNDAPESTTQIGQYFKTWRTSSVKGGSGVGMPKGQVFKIAQTQGDDLCRLVVDDRKDGFHDDWGTARFRIVEAENGLALQHEFPNSVTWTLSLKDPDTLEAKGIAAGKPHSHETAGSWTAIDDG